MKIFTTEQIKKLDEFTIKNEPVASFDLMERAAEQLFRWYHTNFDRSKKINVFIGPGNNGGDGLALARLLSADRYTVHIYYVKISDITSDDWNHNYKRLKNETPVLFSVVESTDQFPLIGSDDIILDAIFGSGLTRPVEGLAALVIKQINQSDSVVVSVDVPSGLFGEDNSENDPDYIVRADYTLSFEFPKLSFMFAENEDFVGEWCVLPIGLSKNAIITTKTPYILADSRYVYSLLKKRNKFDHKGRFGHGILIAGSYGKIGAAILAAKASLRTGIGLITCHVPGCGYQVIQTSVPEAMITTDTDDKCFTDTISSSNYDAAGIGPGLGTSQITRKAFHSFLKNSSGKSVVIDADGINILGLNREWLSELPEKTILTPHPKEFERIAGATANSYKRLERQLEIAAKHNCIVIVKGAYSAIVTPAGEVIFNSTGNPGMATAGSGDVLTGMILSLLSQGYSPEDASVAGVYLHGLAGDLAASKSGFDSLIASDIIDNIGNAYLKVIGNNAI